MSQFNLFVYGTLRGDHRTGEPVGPLAGCTRVAQGTVGGTLYSIDGRFPALIRYGDDPVQGEIWRCPADLLLKLDEYEGVASGLFRRVAMEIEADNGAWVPCWLYTAGPALSQHLKPSNRVASGTWQVHDA